MPTPTFRRHALHFIVALVASLFGLDPGMKAQEPMVPLTPEQLRSLPNRLSMMKPEEFSRWLLGTEWEFPKRGKIERYWFATPTRTIWSVDTEERSKRTFAYQTEKGVTKWFWYPGDQKGLQKFIISDDLKSAMVDNSEAKIPAMLIRRRALPQMTVKMSTPEFEDWLLTHELRSTVRIWFGQDGMFRWNEEKNKGRYTPLAPGLIATQDPNPWIGGLAIFSPDLKQYRWYSWWGNDSGQVVATNSSGGSSNSPVSITGTAPVTIRKQASAVGGLLVVPLGGSRYAGKTSKLSISALKLEGNSAATLAFNQDVGTSMAKALQEVSKYHTLRHGGWPRGQRMEIFFEDKYSPKDGPSAAVACALLLESIIAGVNLDPTFSVTGDMNADGSVQPIGGVIAKLRGAAKAGQLLAAIPQKNRTSATDLVVGEGIRPLLGVQLFSIDTFDEALALARTDRAPDLAKAISSFSSLGDHLKSNPSALTTPAVKNGLTEILEVAPNHVSARLLLMAAQGMLPKQFSPSGSLDAVNQAVAAVDEAAGTDLTATSALDSGKVGAARSRLQRLRGMVDTRVQPLVDAWIAWSGLADLIITRRSATPQLLQQFQAAGGRINAEGKKLEGDSEFVEELLK
ncbi:MAG: S16 family serine protease [Verrucomicrobium sp.]|nr:S16 family serine protease [Verrucomicrobium sp.]